MVTWQLQAPPSGTTVAVRGEPQKKILPERSDQIASNQEIQASRDVQTHPPLCEYRDKL